MCLWTGQLISRQNRLGDGFWITNFLNSAESWNGVRMADKDGNACPQSEGLEVIIGDEDCLFLNVFTPSLKNSIQW